MSLIALLFIYEDEVKSAIVGELNKHLKAEVKIDPKNIDLTIIKTFPDCSIQFKNLLMLEALPIKNRDTLLFAGQLNLHFNIKDLWNKNYQIEKIKLKDAVVKLRVLKDGKPNYIFWKKTETKSAQDNASTQFDLKLISIEDCKLSYKNRKTVFKTSLNIKSLSFKGHFMEENFEMASDARLYIEEIVQGKTNYLQAKNCDFSISLDVSDNSYTLKKADINLNKLGLELSGQFNFSDSLERADIKYNAPNLDISSLLSLLPENYKGKISDYKSSGNFYASGTMRYLDKNTYSFISDFGIKNGQISYKPTSASASNVNLEGYLNYSNLASVLNLKNIHLNLNSDELKGNCLINNFSDPYIKFTAQASTKLENIINFWPIDTLSLLKGNLQIDTEVEGLLSALKDQTFTEKVKLQLEAKVSALEAQFKGDAKIYAIENCLIKAREREIEVQDLKLKRGSSDITLNGKIPGVFNYILDRKSPLIISGNLYSSKLLLEDFMSEGKKSGTSNSNASLIPSNVNFKLNASILKFNFGKFEAGSITGEIEIKNQKAMVSDVKLQTMQGEAEINAFADNSKNRLDVVLQSNLKNINISELFQQLNSFGQTTLTEKNIKGSAGAAIEFSGRWDNNLVSDPRSIQATCNLTIEQGELNDFKPLLSLSKFVDVEELKRVKFSSLQSAVEIKNSTITIPKTSIKNSALDIEVWGTHTFDNRIDYHIQLLINHLLAKKRKVQDSEFGPIENDPDNKRSAFILMTGTLDNPKIKFDKKGLKEKIKSDMSQEKTNMKQLFKEEFKLFKKDSTLKKTKKEETTFELEKPESSVPKKGLELKKKKEDDEDF
ncbi:hypothetical protein CNR22_09925 [Sphingobacteriaceae bacterium]|nr:hypothetical protein CNR22_09925 [Sphingobacteriaceae bacterium]